MHISRSAPPRYQLPAEPTRAISPDGSALPGSPRGQPSALAPAVGVPGFLRHTWAASSGLQALLRASELNGPRRPPQQAGAQLAPLDFQGLAEKRTGKVSELRAGSFCWDFWCVFCTETYCTFSASPRDPNELLMHPILQGFSEEASSLATAANP